MSARQRIKQAIRQESTASDAYDRWVNEDDNNAYTQTLVPLLTQRVGVGLQGPSINDIHAALSDLREQGWTPEA